MAAVLNLYWDLVSFNEAVRIKQQALEAAQKLYDGNKKQVDIGAMAGIEVTRAAAAVSASKEALLIAQTNVRSRKSCSRTLSTATPWRIPGWTTCT